MELDEDIATIAHGSFWHGLNSLIFRFLSFLYTIIIARMVAQEQVGVFYFALGLVGLVGIFSDAGMTQAASRYIPYYLGKKDSKSASLALKVSWDVSMVLGALLAIILFLIADPIASFFSNPPLAGVLRILAVYVFISQVFNVIASWLSAFKMLKEASNGANIQNALKLGVTLALILGFAWADAESLAIATVLSFFVSIFYLYWSVRKKTSKLPPVDNSRTSKGYVNMAGELGTFGLTMVFVLLTATLITYTDRLLLGYFLKEGANSQIAIYSIATGLAGLVGLFAASIMAIFFPVISELHGKGDKAKMNGACSTALRWILFFSLPIAAFLVAFSGPMLHLLYGASYEPGALVLAFFSIGILISLLGTAQRTALAGMRQLQVERNVAILAFIVNLALNVLFIPLWGINGAALASAISLAGMAILNQHYASKLMGFSFPLSAWKNIAAGAISLVVLLLIETFAYNAILSSPIQISGNSVVSLVLDKAVKLASLSIFFLVGAVVYLVLLNFMSLFEREDVAVFRKIISRSGAPAWLQGAAVRAVFWNQKEIR